MGPTTLSKFRDYLDAQGLKSDWSDDQLRSALRAAKRTHRSDINAPGRAMIRAGHFLRKWVARDGHGRRYEQLGIAVGPPPEPTHLATAAPAGAATAHPDQSALLIAYLDAVIDGENGDATSARAANQLHQMLTGEAGPHPVPEEAPAAPPGPDPQVAGLQAQLSTLAARLEAAERKPKVKRTRIEWDDQDRPVAKIEEFVEGDASDGRV